MAGPTKRAGLSLYGNLLGDGAAPSGGNVISSAPVTYTPEQQAEIAKKKKTDAPFGNFQPRISRPQQQQKAMVKQSGLPSVLGSSATTARSSSHKFSSSTVTDGSGITDPSLEKSASKQPASNFQRTTFDDFMTNEQYDDVEYDPRHKRGKGGRNKKRKKDNAGEAKHIWSWDDVYDPAFPNVYGDYKGSEEQAQANSDWKARLYHKKMKETERRRRASAATAARDREETPLKRDFSRTNTFAPPAALLDFAPPKLEDQAPRSTYGMDDDDDDDDPYARLERPSHLSLRAPPSFTASSNVTNGSDASISMSRSIVQLSERPNVQPVAPQVQPVPVPVHARPQASMTDAEKAAKMADAQLKIEALKKKFARQAEEKQKPLSPAKAEAALSPPVSLQHLAPQPSHLTPAPSSPQTHMATHDSSSTPGLHAPPPSQPLDMLAEQTPAQAHGTISRAPIRYNVETPASSDGQAFTTNQQESQEVQQTEETQRVKKPGRLGFAQRILEKQGWQQGQGLGAQGQGITTAIFAQAQKRKKRPDAEGGGWVAPANMGRIVGGKKAKVDGASSNEPQPSVVVKYTGLLAGLDATVEISDNDLYQHIGEAMNEKFGTVERIYVWLAGDNEVFIKFTDGMGALRATTNDFSFKGNTVTGQYFPEDKFEEGDYAGIPSSA